MATSNKISELVEHLSVLAGGNAEYDIYKQRVRWVIWQHSVVYDYKADRAAIDKFKEELTLSLENASALLSALPAEDVAFLLFDCRSEAELNVQLELFYGCTHD